MFERTVHHSKEGSDGVCGDFVGEVPHFLVIEGASQRGRSGSRSALEPSTHKACPPAGAYVLKTAQPARTVPWARDQVLTQMSL